MNIYELQKEQSKEIVQVMWKSLGRDIYECPNCKDLVNFQNEDQMKKHFRFCGCCGDKMVY